MNENGFEHTREDPAVEPTHEECEYFRTIKKQFGEKEELTPLDMAILRKYRKVFGKHVQADSSQDKKNLESVCAEIYAAPDSRHNDHSSYPLGYSDESGSSLREEVQNYALLSRTKSRIEVGKTYRFTRYPTYQPDWRELPESYGKFFNNPVAGTVKRIVR